MNIEFNNHSISIERQYPLRAEIGYITINLNTVNDIEYDVTCKIDFNSEDGRSIYHLNIWLNANIKNQEIDSAIDDYEMDENEDSYRDTTDFSVSFKRLASGYYICVSSNSHEIIEGYLEKVKNIFKR